MNSKPTTIAAPLQPFVRRSYANDSDHNAVEWLSSIPIPIDTIDGRSITDVEGSDLDGYTECHFFAGIGGWPLALRMAGWPADAPVWTGSCPCQPFSAAGKRKGTDDERHLWPEFYRLISECRPTVVFGEQVASKDGRDWLAVVRDQMEALGYAVGAADLCAAGVGAPHIRQRLFWVADRSGEGLEGREEQSAREELQAVERSGDARGVADADGGNASQERQQRSGEYGQQQEDCGDGRWIGNTNSQGQDSLSEVSEREGSVHGMGNAESNRRKQGRAKSDWRDITTAVAWSDIEYIPCRDGKARPVKPGLLVLGHGIPRRVAQLRGLGNAIVPQVAAEFVAAYLECRT